MSFLFGRSSSKTDPAAAKLAQQTFSLGKEQLASQEAFRNQFIVPLLKQLASLGLDPSQMSAVAQSLFGTELEQIGQSFGGQRTGLIDQLASSGFRPGSLSTGLNRLAQGEAQSEVEARRNAVLQNIMLALQGGNIANQQVATFNPQSLFASSLGTFQPLQRGPATAGPALLGAAGQAAQGYLAAGGCWIAEVLYGENDYRVFAIRYWLKNHYQKTFTGSIVVRLYQRFGETIASLIRRFPFVGKAFRPLFDKAFEKAKSCLSEPTLIERLETSMRDRL